MDPILFIQIGKVHYNVATLYAFEESNNGLSVTSAAGTDFHPGLTVDDALDAIHQAARAMSNPLGL